MGSDQYFEKPPADVPEDDVPEEEEVPGTTTDVDDDTEGD